MLATDIDSGSEDGFGRTGHRAEGDRWLSDSKDEQLCVSKQCRTLELFRRIQLGFQNFAAAPMQVRTLGQ